MTSTPVREATIYRPPTYDEATEEWTYAALVCPHCKSTEVVEVDVAVRWNRLNEGIEEADTLIFGTEGDYQFDSEHMLCTACNEELDFPLGAALNPDPEGKVALHWDYS